MELLLKAAIDFGVTARGGESGAWLFLGFASLGAVACLFIGLILVARVLRRLGITNSSSSASSSTPDTKTIEQPRIPGRPAGDALNLCAENCGAVERRWCAAVRLLAAWTRCNRGEPDSA